MRRASILTILLLGGLAWLAPGTSAARGIQLGFADVGFVAPNAQARAGTFDRAVASGAGIIRINVRWAAVARGPEPADPASPADPGYDFEAIDDAVLDARARGLAVLFTVQMAPAWAEGPDRPAGAVRGSWKPNPAKLGQFATALARRYSGGFGSLPRVRHFEVWNEPNLSGYLAPQRIGRRVVSPGHYRKMLNAFYTAAHSVRGDNVVITGGTGPYGDPSGPGRVRPVEFLRRLFCLKGRVKLRRSACPVRAQADAVAHHPINTTGGPGRSALDPDDASSPDLGRIGRVVRAAEHHRTILPRGRHPLWVTEFWWASNPPDKRYGMKPARQARALEGSLYRFWRAGAKVAIYMVMDDRPFTGGRDRSQAGTGIYYLGGKPKPALKAFRFPFVGRRQGKRLAIWARSPSSGRLTVSIRRRAGWRKLAVRRVRAGQVVSFRLRGRHGRAALLRAEVGRVRSLTWRQP